MPFVVSFDTLQDETTDRADLVLPDHHDLESWGAYAGNVGPCRDPDVCRALRALAGASAKRTPKR